MTWALAPLWSREEQSAEGGFPGLLEVARLRAMMTLRPLMSLSVAVALVGCSTAAHLNDTDTLAAQDAPTLSAPAPAPKEKPMTLEERLQAPEDVAAAPEDAMTSASGLAYKVLRAGEGDARPTAEATVEVHYTGWTTDGRRFDSSLERGQTASFPLNRVIRGWTEGLQLMVKGEMTRFWIPAELAYGETPQRPGAPAGLLVFDVELIDFQEPVRVDTPSDVSGPPEEAKRTASGLAYRVLNPGSGEVHPTASSQVKVHYSGWTTDGRLFDSSVVRGQPATFPLSGVIPGWTEGVQLMVVGEKTRFWIPAELAYGETPRRPGAPAGLLVFDVELLAIF